MDVAGGRDTNRNNIGFWKRHNGINQQWDVVYADDMPRIPRRGEMNEDFGLRVGVPFHAVSGLAEGRYL